MSMLLTDGIKAMFGQAFGAIYLPGTLHKKTLIDDGQGGWSTTEQLYPIRVQIDRATEEMIESARQTSMSRQDQGNTGVLHKIIVLQAGVTVKLTDDDRITALGQLWGIMTAQQDPAQSSWICTGYEIRTDGASDDTGAGD